MKIQLYLSAEVINHFAISAQDTQSDTATPLSANWRALWRCDHIISTEDEQEHLFLFTNAVTHYNLIMVDRNHDFASLLGSFRQHLALALHEHGQPFNQQALESEFQLLHGTPTPLTQGMNGIKELAIDCLLSNGADIEATELCINNDANFSTPNSPSANMLARIMPSHTPDTSEILHFNALVAK